MANPLVALQQYGQSPWYDYIRRSLITSGELQHLIDHDGLRGVTSNPSIFEKAIAGSTDYNDALEVIQQQQDMDAKRLYEYLAIGDIQVAADVMTPVYTQTHKRDGYVSLEVSPCLANDTDGTLEEARRLWHEVQRPNVMIKVPATPAGLPAIQQLISEGINVNVTLLFHIDVYEQMADAYMSGLESLIEQGGNPEGIASVASFFISRIDSAVDQQLTERLKTATQASERSLLRSLLGKVAIANAKLTYQHYKALTCGARWQALAAKGAQSQRLLWASTSTKNPHYRDVMYVEELIGPDTVHTIPTATFDAFREHGRLRASLEENLEEAHDTMEALEEVNVSMQAVTDQLLEEGVTLFAEAFDKLLSAVAEKRQTMLGDALPRQSYVLPSSLNTVVEASLEDWREHGKVRRLWTQDATLWTGSDEGNWLGWLGITDDQLAHVEHLRNIAKEAQNAGFSHAVLLGMGGSSLCPEVMRMTLVDLYQLGAEMFRWEVATAVAGAIMGIHPFNQPDVEASKMATRHLTSNYEKSGTLPSETPIFEDNGVKLFTDTDNAAALAPSVGNDRSLVGYLKAHLGRLHEGDYFGLLAYVDMCDAHQKPLQEIRQAVRDTKHVATCLGYGPRFLHSTGQAYKGGPNTGVFLQITCDDAEDLPVPGRKYTFGVVKAAQARGDFQVLAERQRRALRVHLGPDVVAGLTALQTAITEALE